MAPKKHTGVRIKRIYEPPSEDDGQRVLVDRIWPRGVAKEKAGIDKWLKEVAPSTALRRWFGHEADKWDAFQDRYRKELLEHEDAIGWLLDQAIEGRVTLLYSARDEEHNQAVALQALLQERLNRR